MTYSKYNAKPTWYNEMRFASKAECERWKELELRARAGEIRALRRQVPYPLFANGMYICRYDADAVYEEWQPLAATWHEIVEDTKGVRTAEYKIKKRLMRAVLGIDIREIDAHDYSR